MQRPVSPSLSSAQSWLQRRDLWVKIVGIGFLGLVLLIPLSFVRDTLAERAAHRAEAVEEITRTWGGTQHVVGPVLVVPFTHRVTTEEAVPRGPIAVREKVERVHTAEAFFLPEFLEVTGGLETAERRRGIHRADVYTARVRLAGRFARPDLAFSGAKGVEPQWEQARLCFGLSDLRGARGALQVTWNGTQQEAAPGTRLALLPHGVQVPVAWRPETTSGEFALELTLNGSGGFFVMPAGRTTRVHLNSTWADPSFAGAYLPTSRQVSAAGFEADWEVSYYGRNVPPQWSTVDDDLEPTAAAFHEAVFGVNLFDGVNAYRVIERAIKYGVLFIALVFAVFFLFETFAGTRLNALNYLLVGAALCLFYLALLALSEFIAFGAAYTGAAAASVGLIGCYSWHILARPARAWLVSGMLGAVYAYLYFVLHMEDYSLLAGTAALFAMLAAVMYATRRLQAGAAEPPVGAVPPPPLPLA